jgi:nucleoside 2-deoxyribosyltransferase
VIEFTEKDKKKLYLAAPLFSKAELDFNRFLKDNLEAFFDIYLPQENGELMVNLIEQGIPHNLAAKRIFLSDIKALNECDIFLIILDGRSVDEGAAFELGFAFSHRKKCFGLMTDVRSMLRTGNNPMIDASLNSIFRSIEELIEWAATQ